MATAVLPEVKTRRLLHVGCGSQPLPSWLSQFDEVRVDIDPETKPQFVRDMLNLHDLEGFDALYCCHALEHLYPYQVPRALAEFKRVLKPQGAVIIMVPDLEDVRPNLDPILTCDMGPMCGLDLFYGHHAVLESQPYMAHHCGFIASVLKDALIDAGFTKVSTQRLANYNLCGTGEKPE